MSIPAPSSRFAAAAASLALLAPSPSFAVALSAPRAVRAPAAPVVRLAPGTLSALPLSASHLSPSYPSFLPLTPDAAPSAILSGGPLFVPATVPPGGAVLLHQVGPAAPSALPAPGAPAPRLELSAPTGEDEAAPRAAESANAMGADAPNSGLVFDAALTAPRTPAVEAAAELAYRTPASADGRVALEYGSRVILGADGKAQSVVALRVGIKDLDTAIVERSGTVWLKPGESLERVAPLASASDPRKVYFAVRDADAGTVSIRSLDMDTQRMTTVLETPVPADERDYAVIGLSDDGASLHAYGKTGNILYKASAAGGVERVLGPAGYKESVHALPDGRLVVNQGKFKLSVYEPGETAPKAVTLEVETAADGSKSTAARVEGKEGVFRFEGESRFRGSALYNKGKAMTLRMVTDGVELATAKAVAEREAAERAILEARVAAFEKAEQARREAMAAQTGDGGGPVVPGAPTATAAGEVPAPGSWAQKLPGDARPLPGAGLIARFISTMEALRRHARSLSGQRIAKPSELDEYADLMAQRKLILAQVDETLAEGTNRSGKGSAGRFFRLMLGAVLTGAVALGFVAADVVIFSGFWSGILGGPFGVPASLMPLLIGSSLWGLVAVGIVHAAKGKNRAMKAVAVATLMALFVVGVMVGLSHLGVDPAAAAAAVGGDGGFLGGAAAPAAGAAAAPLTGVFAPVGEFLRQFPVLGPAVFGVFAVASSLSAGSWLFNAAGMFSRAFGDKRLDGAAWDRLDSLQRVRMGEVRRRMAKLERAIPDIESQVKARLAAQAAEAAAPAPSAADAPTVTDGTKED